MNFWQRLRFGSVGRDFYRENRMILCGINYKFVRLGSLALFFIEAVFSAVCVIARVSAVITAAYLCFAAAFLALFLLVRFFLQARKQYTDFFYYAMYALAFAQTLIASTLFSPENRMVSVFFVIIILPALHVEKPVRSCLTVLGSCLVSLAAVFAVKSARPDLLADDSLAILACFLSAIPFVLITRSTSLNYIQERRFFQIKAETDEMTGVYNREGTELLIGKYLETGSPCALFLVDLDDFKRVNDTLGHARGDEVLRLMGAALRENFRQEDVIGRIGGDEFVAFMKGVDSPALLRRKAEGIRTSINRIYSEYSREQVTCSMGIAVRTDEAADYRRLFETADRALYASKRAGKNRYELGGVQDNAGGLPLMLVADDAEVSRAILKACFENEYRILEAENGAEAVKLAEEYGAELAVILMDMEMPVMRGEEAIRRIRESTRLRGIPIIVITAHNESELEALQLGAADLIEKPFDPEVCRIRVKNAVDARR